MLGVPLLSQAVNKFTSDTPTEMALLTKAAVEAGASGAVVSDHWAKGGAGALELVSPMPGSSGDSEVKSVQ